MQQDQLCELVSRAIGVERSSVDIETKSMDLPEWDSLGHISVLMAIQEHFGESFQEDPALASAVSVKELYEVLQR